MWFSLNSKMIPFKVISLSSKVITLNSKVMSSNSNVRHIIKFQGDITFLIILLAISLSTSYISI